METCSYPMTNLELYTGYSMSNDPTGIEGFHKFEFLLTNPSYHAKMTPVSEKETPGWRKYPAANLLDEDYLGSIVRYNIE